MPVASVSSGAGVAFMVGAGLVFEIVAAACSSPQTTELNADSRAPTLMKWVTLGLAGSAVFIGIAATIEPKRAGAIISGGGLAGGLMYVAYIHAKSAGLASSEPETETY
jgi:hypothetical protein